jgi:hypothetical protein
VRSLGKALAAQPVIVNKTNRYLAVGKTDKQLNDGDVIQQSASALFMRCFCKLYSRITGNTCGIISDPASQN